jgi:GTP cyclohydrolase I
MFVEDIVRAVTEKLKTVEEIQWFRVECENFESIHNHSAYALVEYAPGQEEPAETTSFP